VANKKIAAKKTAQGEFREIKARLRDLQLDLNKVTKQIKALCQSPLRPGPYPPASSEK
jgi:hypothetical protein